MAPANCLDKAVILTDGYASMTLENAQALRTRRVRTLAILFAGKQDCPEWAPYGDVLTLEDAAP